MKLWIAALTGMCAALAAHAESNNLKVVEASGHLSPVAIRVTYSNDQTRNLMLVGIGSSLRDNYLTHQLIVRADGGASQRMLWFDAIASIRGASTLRTLGDEFTITMKDGKQFPAMFTRFFDLGTGACTGEATDERFACNVLVVRNEDDGIEKLDLRKVKQVDFLAPPRRDKAGNAMFDPWRYSPFTGERLP
jgi:hypothetical protein